jgi:hypothetical protein
MTILSRLSQVREKRDRGDGAAPVHPTGNKRSANNPQTPLAGGYRQFAVTQNQRPVDPLRKLKQLVHKRLVDEVDPVLLSAVEQHGDTGVAARKALSDHVAAVLDAILQEEQLTLDRQKKASVVAELLDEMTGFGPINPLIHDDSISEIMVNGPNVVFVERHGKLEQVDVRFRDNDHVQHIIEKIVAPLGRRIDESSPMVDARLPDGSRVNAIIPPLVINGPTITIRKFSRDPLTCRFSQNPGPIQAKTVKAAKFTSENDLPCRRPYVTGTRQVSITRITTNCAGRILCCKPAIISSFSISLK